MDFTRRPGDSACKFGRFANCRRIVGRRLFKRRLRVLDAAQLLIDQLLESTPRPTAAFAAADSVAALAYCILGMRGIRVGQDISVIAGNNTPGLLSIPLPHLATFDIDARKIGALAVRQWAMQIAEHNRVRSGASEVQQISCRVVVTPTFITRRVGV
jgi:DNA-binding LacI/PurR family transcriptional regulator